ncbi:MAG: TRAP transporter small permease subunit [Pseudomonadota bacterium]
MEALSAAAFRVAAGGAIIAVVVMVATALWQVVARYILDQPPPWTEELARYSMVWVGLLGASCAFRMNSDPTLFPAMRDVRGRLGSLLSLVRTVGVLFFVFPIVWFSIFGRGADIARGYLARMSGREALTMDVPMVVFAVAIPISFAFIIIHLLARLSADLSGVRSSEAPAEASEELP